MLPPPCFTVGMVFFGLQAFPFFLNITMVIKAKQFYFCFIRPEDISPKKVQLQTVVWLFYGGFGAVASSLLCGLSGYVDIGLIFTVDIENVVLVSSSIFTRSFAVLGLICTFRTKVC